jgi:hypothetical protein
MEPYPEKHSPWEKPLKKGFMSKAGKYNNCLSNFYGIDPKSGSIHTLLAI